MILHRMMTDRPGISARAGLLDVRLSVWAVTLLWECRYPECHEERNCGAGGSNRLFV